MDNFVNQDIEPYSPLSKSMCLLNKVVSIEDGAFSASVILNESSTFADSDGVPGWLGIEYMAQAIAAFAGVRATKEKQPVEIGFLLGSRKYQSSISCFPFHKEIVITVSELLQDESGLGVYDCSINIDDEIVASAKLNVFQPKDPIQFIEEQKS